MKFEPTHPVMVTMQSAINPDATMQQKVRALNDEVASFVESHGGDSISQLSWCVNDGAGTKTFGECYQVGEILGQGGFAVVYQCTHKQNSKTYAVKEIINEKEENSKSEDVKGEIQALRKLKEGPYVVRLHDVFYEPEHTFLVLEQMMGGDMLQRLCEKEIFSERDARRISRTLLEAIRFCHNKRIVHRDIKPENILMVSPNDDTAIKLADFGCSKRITGPKCLHTLCGTPRYVAPEILTDFEEGYDERCDLWSAGCVIYILLGGYAPFEATQSELVEVITDGYFEFHDKYWHDISDPPKDLIDMLLQVNPDERASANEALDSEWLKRRDAISVMSDSCTSFDRWLHKKVEKDGLSSAHGSQTVSFHDSFDSILEIHSAFDDIIEDMLSDDEGEDDDEALGEGKKRRQQKQTSKKR